MSRKCQNLCDPVLKSIHDALESYDEVHSKARIDINRQNSVAVRIRIIDPDFRGKDLVDRDSEIWDILSRLSEDVQSQITLLLLLTPQEAKKSFANVEFEHPLESQL